MEASEEKPTVTITYDQELPDCPCSQEDLKDKLLEAHKLQHWKCSCNSGLSPECDELLHHINRIKKDLEARVDNHLECVCALGKNNNELFARIEKLETRVKELVTKNHLTNDFKNLEYCLSFLIERVQKIENINDRLVEATALLGNKMRHGEPDPCRTSRIKVKGVVYSDDEPDKEEVPTGTSQEVHSDEELERITKWHKKLYVPYSFKEKVNPALLERYGE